MTRIRVKELIRRLTPPLVAQAAEWLLSRSGLSAQREWEFLPGGWPAIERTQGWDDRSVATTQGRNWQAFLDTLRGTNPLVISHEDPTLLRVDYGVHNAYMTYGYILALAGRQKHRLSVLDWGGGLGHYYFVGRALLPSLALDYHCKDLPRLCETGRLLVPEVTFHESTTWQGRTYDVVLASSSLQYSLDWKQVLGGLTAVTGSYLYLAHMPIVTSSESFVVLQRAYKYGYNVEYPGWFLNKDEVLCEATRAGLNLVREFVLFPGPRIANAPEHSQYGGFLFQPAAAADNVVPDEERHV